jgi:hypothetical protein
VRAVVHDPIICGQRETRVTGTWECVAPYGHTNSAHYYVLLVSRPEAS